MTSDEFRAKLKLECDLFTARHGYAPQLLSCSQKAYDLLRGRLADCHTFMDARVQLNTPVGAVVSDFYVELYAMGHLKTLSWGVLAQQPVE